MKRIALLIVMALFTASVACAQKKTTKKKEVKTEKKQEKKEVTLSDSIASVINKANAGDVKAQEILAQWYFDGFETVPKDHKLAAAWWAKATEQGSATAAGELGFCYQKGDGVEADSLKAVELFKDAIKKKNEQVIPKHVELAEKEKSIFSSLFLADIYRDGKLVNRDAEASLKYRQMAAGYGDVESMMKCGLQFYNTKKYGESAEYFKQAADKGDVVASYFYGEQMFYGKGVSQDKKKGIEIMKKAADAGNVAANYELGRIYLEGDGVDKDANKAVKCLEKAACDYQPAAWLLGLCYKDGEGVDKNFFFAAQWLAEGLDDGKQSRELVNKMLEDDKDGEFTQYLRGLYRYYIDERYVEALKFFKKVKNVEGTTMTALCHANKKNEVRNLKKAVKAFKKAAKTSPAANYFLSTLYETGTGVDKDEEKAVELLSKAADEGVAYAQCKLGDRCFKGIGVDQDLEKAAELYLKAEQQHYLSKASASNLAQLYVMQISSLPDLDKAKERITKLENQKTSNKLNLLLSRVSMK